MPIHASQPGLTSRVRDTSSLPERQRAVLMLREVEDLSYGGVLETAHPATPLAA